MINAIGAAATFLVLIIVTYTKFADGAWIVIVAMPIIVFVFYSIHRHYMSIMAQLRRGTVTPGDSARTTSCCWSATSAPSTAEALGYVRSFRPPDVHAVFPTDGDTVPVEIQDRWRAFAGGDRDLEPLPMRGGDVLSAMRAYLHALARDPNDFVTVIVPEEIRESLFGYLIRRREPGAIEGRAAARAERRRHRRAGGRRGRGTGRCRCAATDPPANGHAGVRLDGERRDDPSRQLRPFDRRRRDAGDLLRPGSRARRTGWSSSGSTDGLGIPLDIVEAPFRDLTGPMLDEVRRFTVRQDTVVNVVIPEFLVTSGGTTCCTTRTRCSSSGCSCSRNARCCRACRSSSWIRVTRRRAARAEA